MRSDMSTMQPTSTLLLAATATLVALPIAYLLLTRKPRRATRPVPAPPRSLLFGHIPLLIKGLTGGPKGEVRHIDEFIVELVPQYGKTFVLDVVFAKLLIVLDPDMIKEIVAVRNYQKSPGYVDFFPFMGGEKSILVLEGNAWHKQRQAFNPGFSYQHLKNLIPTFVSNTERLARRLTAAAATGETAPLHRLLTMLTMNIICEVVLDKDFDLLSEEKAPELFDRYGALMEEVLIYANRTGFGWTKHFPWNKARMQRLQSGYDNMLLPLIRQKLAAAAPATAPAAAAAAAAATKGSNSAAAGEVVQAVSEGSTGSPMGTGAKVGGGSSIVGGSGSSGSSGSDSGRSVLTLAVQTAQQQDGGSSLDVEHVLAQVKTFLFAGHDTTAAAVAWAVYEVSRQPEIERKVVEEIRQVCGHRDPTADDLNQLKYIGCVVKEALRMWPPAGTSRTAPRGDVLEGYDMTGYRVYIPHYVIHRDTQLWGPDANVFRPERWLDEAAVRAMHPYAYQPFSRGPRDCLGQTFAILEAKTLLAMLYSRFSFAYAGSEPERQVYKVTSHPRYGCPMRVTLREWCHTQEARQLPRTGARLAESWVRC